MSHTVVPYFLYAAGILFREGLEALLVVIALVAGTREAGHENRAQGHLCRRAGRDRRQYRARMGRQSSNQRRCQRHARRDLPGARRRDALLCELMADLEEPGADRWNSFIETRSKAHKESAVPGLALALTAFLAVIREGAETIVFFQALTVGATETVEKHAVMAGIAAATVGLAITFIVLQSRGASNPVRQVLLCNHDPALWTRGGFHRPGNRELPGIGMDRRDLHRACADHPDARAVSDRAEYRGAARADRVRRGGDGYSAWLGAGGKGGSGSFCRIRFARLDLRRQPRADPPSPITISWI